MTYRTPLTYYGGKQQMASQIVALMPAHVAYLEPFGGGAAVLFAKPPAERETLNDLDSQIMRFWRVLREQPEQLAAAIAATPYSREEWQRAHDPSDDDLEAARRLLVRIDQSFSREGKSWSPPSLSKKSRGRWQPGTWSERHLHLLAAAERLRHVCLENTDACELIPRWDLPDAVIYVDPPYAGPDRRHSGHGYAHDDAEDLWPRLVEVLSGVKHAAVILSGYPCPAAESLDWRRIDVPKRNSVATAGSLDVRSEALWVSPAVVGSTPTLFEEVAHG